MKTITPGKTRVRDRDLLIAVVLVFPLACTGAIQNGAEDGDGVMDPGDNDPARVPGLGRDLAATVGVRRLTRDEYDNTVRDLVGSTRRLGGIYLPADARKPFDDYRAQQAQISDSLIQSVDLLSSEIARDLVLDVARRDRIVGCKATDPTCLTQFVTRFGRRALRRPLANDEIQLFLQVPRATGTQGDFYASVEALVRTFLQDPEFLHRVEVGQAVDGKPGLFRLNGWEMASRLSYLLWGSMPSDALFDRAQGGGLTTAADVRAAAGEMLAGKDPRVRERVALFHALWLGYERDEIPTDMKNEASALFGRVIFDEGRPWQDVFRSQETFVTHTLARHYGLPIPAGFTATSKPMWVPYASTSRQGLLSQGGFLSLAGTMDEEPMTIRRGKAIYERLLCAKVPEAKPAEVAKPTTPPVSPCKWDVLSAHRQAACASCHEFLDVAGFGLDNYDGLGKYRASFATLDPKTQKTVTCRVRAEGRLAGTAFSGPRQLTDIVLSDVGRLNHCVVKQLYRFAFSRNDVDPIGEEITRTLSERLGTNELHFADLILDFVSSTAFAHRRTDTAAN